MAARDAELDRLTYGGEPFTAEELETEIRGKYTEPEDAFRHMGEQEAERSGCDGLCAIGTGCEHCDREFFTLGPVPENLDETHVFDLLSEDMGQEEALTDRPYVVSAECVILISGLPGVEIEQGTTEYVIIPGVVEECDLPRICGERLFGEWNPGMAETVKIRNIRYLRPAQLSV